MKTTIQAFCFGVATMAALGSAPLFAQQNPEPGKKHVIININGETQTYKLEDFTDGETKTFQLKEGKTATVTRHGDKLEVSVDGKALPTPDGAGGKKVVIIRRDVNAQSNGDGKEKVIVLGEGPEGTLPEGGGNVMVFTHRDGEAPNGATIIDERTMVLKTDPNGEPVTVNYSGQTKVYTLKGKTDSPTIDTNTMADGETRTVAADGHVLAVTRTGDKFKVAIDGKELPTPRVITFVKKEDKK
jgi:hypothetical protein